MKVEGFIWNNLKLRNGGIALLSIITKWIMRSDNMKTPAICKIFSLFTPIWMIVSAMRNEDIVIERATMPLISIENGFPFFCDAPPLSMNCLIDLVFCIPLQTFAVNSVIKIVKGIIARKVICQPKVWIMLAPTNSSATEII